MKTYVVATAKPWQVAAFHRHVPDLPGNWQLLQSRGELSPERVRELEPRYIFFPHWSWIVPKAVLEAAECVCFHMTDVPYGRGGSPLQNLIVRGHTQTQLTALRMIEDLDAGPVYFKRPLALYGSAQQIFVRAAELTFQMIAEMVRTEPQPVPQAGEPVTFQRRTPEMSRLPQSGSLGQIHDHIRMLDAESYPRAFLEHGEFRLEFSEAEAGEGEVKATVRIRRRGEG